MRRPFPRLGPCAALVLLATAACQPDATAPSATTPSVAPVTLRTLAAKAATPQWTVVEESKLATAAAQQPLPAYLTAAEKLDAAKNDAADDFRNATPQWFAQTEPPAAGAFRPFGEWEEMTQVWTTYSSGMPSSKPVRRMFAEQTIAFIRDSSPVVDAMVIVNNESNGKDFLKAVDEYGITPAEKEHVKLVVMPNQTIWHIDYGPFPLLRKSDGVLAFADYMYYHPRQIDDAIPTRIAQDFLGDVSVYRMPFPFEGGNIQADGVSKCMTSNRALGNTGFSALKVRNLLRAYNGCEETFIVKDISDDGTGHIDMFFKWSAADEVIFGKYENELTLDYDGDGKTETLPMPGKVAKDYVQTYDMNQKRMDDNAALMAAATAANGKPFKVHRLSMMTRYKDSYGNLPRTFINSTFTNGVNAYPSYTPKSCQNPNGAACMIDADCAVAGEHCAAGKCTLNPNGPTAEGCDELLPCPDDQTCVSDPFKVALIAQVQKQWETAMPKWKHVGLRADTIGLWSGAIHCITRTIPKAKREKIVADALCTGGSCACVDGGADNACTADAQCFGPAWVCNCNVCKGNCKADGKACMDDADCAGKDGLVEEGACIQDRDQACKGQSDGVGACGDTPWEGVCEGKKLKFCSAGAIKELPCAGCCGWSNGDGSSTCLAGAACSDACIPECEKAGHFGCSAEGSHTWECVEVGGCLKRTYVGCGKQGCDNKTGKCATGNKPAPVCPGQGGEDAGSHDAGGGDDTSGGDDAQAGDATSGDDVAADTGAPVTPKPAPKSGGCSAGSGVGGNAGGVALIVAMLAGVLWSRRRRDVVAP